MRKLATIRQIQSVEPIVGKDRVELAHVDGWTCMVSKADAFREGIVFRSIDGKLSFKAVSPEFLIKHNE